MTRTCAPAERSGGRATAFVCDDLNNANAARESSEDGTSAAPRRCESVCAIQLAKDLAEVPAEAVKKMVIAYEPVWAIGTGLVCPSDTAQKVHAFIRSKIASMYDQATADAVRIQYGGSVSPESVDELMAKPDIDGCLVGGASLKGDAFGRILNYE